MKADVLDVSSHNTVLDWEKVKNAGISDVFIRLSMGFNTKDKKADIHAAGAEKAGVKVSYYHFAYPSIKKDISKAHIREVKTITKKHNGKASKEHLQKLEEDARQEADYFVSLFQGGKMPEPKWLALDLETWENGRDSSLTKSEYNDWVTIFLAEVNSRVGSTPCLIYSNKPYLDLHLPSKHKLGKIPLWIANYNNVPQPPLPVGWNSYFLWQYTETGTIPGIKGNCDLSRSYQSVLLEQLVNNFNMRKSRKPVPEEELANR